MDINLIASDLKNYFSGYQVTVKSNFFGKYIVLRKSYSYSVLLIFKKDAVYLTSYDYIGLVGFLFRPSITNRIKILKDNAAKYLISKNIEVKQLIRNAD